MFGKVCKGVGIAVVTWLAADVLVLAYEGLGAVMKPAREENLSVYEAHREALENTTDELLGTY